MAERGGVLGRIAAAKRQELSERFANASLEGLRACARRTDRSLKKVLDQPGSRFVLEIKKASPSGGLIRPEADPAHIARGYAGVADALSVLCDAPFFGGSLDDLRAARKEFEGPILAKDFFMDARQVAEARIAGADAVLVMLSLLEDDQAREIILEAENLGMDALVEVHDESEMRRALGLGCPMIGINNRDLRDLSIDLSTTERLASLAVDRVLVSESGIETRSDVERLARFVDGFLIGSSLMRARDPAQAARELIFGRTKVCGLNCGADVSAARPAAFAGFVFVPGSPRQVSQDEAVPLAGKARQAGTLPVAVFRNARIHEVLDVARQLDLHAVQLHGQEEADYLRSLRRSLPQSCEIWRAVSVGREPLVNRGADRLLFDNGEGGTGRSFDWSLVSEHSDLASAIIAGGIGPHNARSAQALGAYAIDIGSSLDAAAGKKSTEKMGILFDALRCKSRGSLRPCA